MGILTGKNRPPNVVFKSSRIGSYCAFSASMLLTTTTLARPNSSAKSHTFEVPISMPCVAWTTTTAKSDTFNAARLSAMKSR